MELAVFFQILYSLVSIPIYEINKDKKPSLYSDIFSPNKMTEIIKKNRIQVISKINEKDIVRLKDYSNLTYIGFKLENSKIVIGPFLEQETSLSDMINLKRRLRMIGEEAIMLDNMFNQLRVLTTIEIDYIYNLIINLSNRTFNDINYQVISPQKIENARSINIERLFEETKTVTKNYQIENKLLNIIETGNVEQAKKFEFHEIMVDLPERAINDSLRNSKTRLTILNTICNRAAIRGGIDVQLGHQISTNLGITIETMTSNFDSKKITQDILISYAEAVYNYAINDYSNLIRSAILYIRRQITTSVSLSDIASFLFVSKEHLSRQFKKETKMTVSKYINHSKIVESKKLLKQKNHTILDISTMLGFSSSSHFTKVFKEEVKLTPKAYQKAHYKS